MATLDLLRARPPGWGRGVGLSLPHRSRTGIVGPSGGGKTTLLQIIAGLLEADTGLVRVGDATTAQQRLARCALMPQRDPLLPWRTALDNAAIALQNRGASRAAALRAAYAALRAAAGSL